MTDTPAAARLVAAMAYDPNKDEDGPTYCTKCGYDDCIGNCR